MATITIDTDNESPSTLSALATFLSTIAGDEVPTPKAAAETVTPATTEDVTTEATVTPVTTPATTEATEATEAPAAPATDVLLDDSGRAWDERIDSSSKAKNANGTWKARRNVDKAVRQAVLDELSGAAAPPAEAPAVTAPPGTPATAPQDPPADQVFGNAGTAAPTAQEAPADWPAFLNRLTVAQRDGKLDQAISNEWLATQNVKAVPLLAQRQELWAPYLEHMGI